MLKGLREKRRSLRRMGVSEGESRRAKGDGVQEGVTIKAQYVASEDP